LSNICLKVSKKLHWIIKTLQPKNPFPYPSFLILFRIIKCLICLLFFWVKTEISHYARPCFYFDQDVFIFIPAFIISVYCTVIRQLFRSQGVTFPVADSKCKFEALLFTIIGIVIFCLTLTVVREYCNWIVIYHHKKSPGAIHKNCKKKCDGEDWAKKRLVLIRSTIIVQLDWLRKDV